MIDNGINIKGTECLIGKYPTLIDSGKKARVASGIFWDGDVYCVFVLSGRLLKKEPTSNLNFDFDSI